MPFKNSDHQGQTGELHFEVATGMERGYVWRETSLINMVGRDPGGILSLKS